MLKSEDADDVNSLVSSQSTKTRFWKTGWAKILRGANVHPKKLNSQCCDLAALWKRVEAKHYFVTKPSEEDGWRGITPQCRKYTLSREPSRKNLCRKSRRDKNWTSHWSSCRTDRRNSWTRNCSSIKTRPFNDVLGADIQREEWLRERSACTECQAHRPQCWITLRRSKLERHWILWCYQYSIQGTRSEPCHSFCKTIVFYERNHSSVWKDGENHSHLSYVCRKNPFDSHLKNVDKNWKRHFDQDERQNDAAAHWDSIVPVLLKAFADKGAHELSQQEWTQHIHQGSNKVRFEYCENS